jgi:hypothetical protein
MSLGQQLLSIIETDALVNFAPPLLTFLTAVQAANGDPIKLGVAWVKLQGDAVAAAPTALGGLEGQLAALLAAKVQSLATAAAPAKPAS